MAKQKMSISKLFVWILMGMLIVGLMGFGATSFTGTTRAAGSVGNSEIGLNAYARALQNEIRAVEAQIGQPVPFQQAQALGLPERVLSQMVVSAALEHEADALSLSVGDERLAQDLRNIAAFRGSDGGFNREAYAFALQNAGLSESEFEADLRDESAATILQGAVLAGSSLPDTYIDTLVAYAGETRDFTWAELGADALTTGLPVPGEAELTAWYDDNIALFTLPETKVITFAWLTPDMIVDSVEVDADTLRAAYDERDAEFNQPERRLVERLVFADDASAQSAADRLAAGEVDFETLVSERGLDLADTDLGDIAQPELGPAGEVVFAAETGDVVGPAPSDLGPALYRVNGVLAAQQTSFEEAEPVLRDALALDRARRVIEAQGQSLDDELAAGATLEELADTTDAELGQIDWTPQSADGIAAYDAFRDAARALGDSDFPQIDQLGDGGLFAMRLDEVRPPAPQPFEEVRDAVLAGWEQAQQTRALVEEAEALRAALAEGQSFEAQSLTGAAETGVSRNAFGMDLPQGLLTEAFTMGEGDVSVIPGDGVALILRLDAIHAADPESEQSQLLAQTFGDRAEQSVAQDLFRALASDIQTRAGVEIDRQAINAVHLNFQ